MAKLNSIADLQDEQIELLEAAGYVEIRHLANATAPVIHAELRKANDMLEILNAAPKLEDVEKWVAQARGEKRAPKTKKKDGEPAHKVEEVVEEAVESESGIDPAEAVDDQSEAEAGEETKLESEPEELVDYEADPDVQDMLAKAPLALPIPNKQLAERGIPPAEVSIAPVLNRASGDLDVRVSARSTEKKHLPGLEPKSKVTGVVQVANYRESSRRGFDSGRVRTMDDARAGISSVKPLTPSAPSDENDRVRLLKTAREATNRGKDPQSRTFVRGVLHDRSIMVWMGCLFMVLFQLVLPLAIIAAPLLILSDHKPEAFQWVPKWIIAFPIALPIVGLFCLMISVRVKCRVCGQKVLLPRQCRKNVKAHHVRGLGYVLPLAIHTLIYRWFNCTFCGTSVRIKE